jgi:MFS family permease
VVTPAGMRWIRFNCAENQRGTAVGLYMAAAKFGPALGAQLATWLMLLYGWRNMFLIIGIGCMVWLIPWLTLVRNDDQDLEKASVRKSAAPGVPFTRVIASPVIWGTVVGTFCYQYFVYYCMTWMPQYFQKTHGMSIEKSNWFSGVSFGGMAAVAAISGWAADRLISQGKDPIFIRKAFTISGFILAATQTLSVLTTSESLMIFLTIASLCGLGLATANYWALTQTLMPGALPVAIQNTAANLAGIVAPWLTGWMIKQTGSFNTPIIAVGFWLGLGVVAYGFLVRRR